MPDQIYLGNFKGLNTYHTAFNIDNVSFPILFNAYAWRGRVKRKRGTKFLGRLTRQLSNVSVAQFSSPGMGVIPVNLFTLLGLSVSQPGASIVPGTLIITIAPPINQTLTDISGNGTLTISGGGTVITAASINYATGVLTLTFSGAAAPSNTTITMSYYPSLPVMGLQDFRSSVASSQYPILLAFDTTYSYQCNQMATNATFYSTSYYKQSNNPVVWSGQNYQQFWTTNYPNTTPNFSGSLWATNNKPGFHYVIGTSASLQTGFNITFHFTNSGTDFTILVINDALFFNEWASNINGLTGTVTNTAGAAGGIYVVTFTTSVTVTMGDTGIAQTLTNSVPVITGLTSTPQDGIRWYDGDPTSGTGLPTGTNLGWVNFSPPLTATTVSIDNTPIAKYYLVGALAILPFKDRLLFFSPYIQSSTLNGGSGIVFQLQDTVLWSWNGTPYYNALVPLNQTFDIRAYYVDQTGLGGYLPAGISSPIITVGNNEDVLLIGFGGDGRKTRFVYSGNDLQPFLFFSINSELPSQSTFSSIDLDKGMIDIGQYGIAMTDQQSAQRIDLDIPDSVFTIQATNNGAQRVNAIRDFYREWIYFSYPVASSTTTPSQTVFPTQTFMYNYRDNTWGILYENYTKHGYYRPSTKKTWSTTGFRSWNDWREPWISGITSAFQTEVISGNPQGYVLIQSQGTSEAQSGYISAIANSGGITQITSVDHCVTDNNDNTDSGDYLYFTNALGITPWNGLIGKVVNVIDTNNFVVDIPFPTGTYIGLGQFARLSQPLIVTKMFNPYWNEGKQVRTSAQKYLMDMTSSSQVTVDLYLSQDPDTPYNDPIFNPPPNSLVYSQILFTCPESTNLGLTPANVSLQNQLPTGAPQGQIWHRMNTSMIGDSFQLGITLSDAQMRNLQYATDEIVLHGINLTVDKSSLLS